MASDVNEGLRADIARWARYRCEYCLIHEDDAGFPHQVDHILSRKHAGASTIDNLAYACVICNGRRAVTSLRSIRKLGRPCGSFILGGTDGAATFGWMEKSSSPSPP